MVNWLINASQNYNLPGHYLCSHAFDLWDNILVLTLMYVQTCAGGLAQSVQPQQECYPRQESGGNICEGITERDTPAGMCMRSRIC